MTISNLSPFDAWRARLALMLIGLAWVLPFQSPNFFEPISSFYGEAAAVVLGLAAVTCLYSRLAWPAIQLPRSSLVFLGFAALILLHVALGRTVYPQQNLLAVLYLIWATAIAAAAWRLREIFGLEALVATLSWFTLAGALTSAAIGLAQLWGGSSPLQPFMLPQVNGRIFANTGQPNHLASYLCMGIASLILLHGAGRVRLPHRYGINVSYTGVSHKGWQGANSNMPTVGQAPIPNSDTKTMRGALPGVLISR